MAWSPASDVAEAAGKTVGNDTTSHPPVRRTTLAHPRRPWQGASTGETCHLSGNRHSAELGYADDTRRAELPGGRIGDFLDSRGTVFSERTHRAMMAPSGRDTGDDCVRTRSRRRENPSWDRRGADAIRSTNEATTSSIGGRPGRLGYVHFR